MQREQRFREDLFARLNEYQLRLPALHERKEDIYALIRAFLAQAGRPELRLTVPFMVAALHHDYPYNVRELEGAIKRAVALSTSPELEVELLPDAMRESVAEYGRSGSAAAVPKAEAEDEGPAPPNEAQLRALLGKHAGNVAAVGRELGKARMQIHRWMRRYGIEVGDYRE